VISGAQVEIGRWILLSVLSPSHHYVHIGNTTQGTDLGVIASSLSPALGRLEEGLQRVRESASIEFSHVNLGLVFRVNLGLTRNSEFCQAFFRRCVSFGDIIIASSSAFIAYPAFARTKSSNDLRDRVMALRTEGADLSVDQPQGLSLFASLALDTSC
jgi:hypothetical protein